MELLRKFSRIYEVQMDYARELRETTLKKEFLNKFAEAASKYNFHMRLVRNFARILNRPLKIQTNLVLKQGFGHIQAVKVPLSKGMKDRRSAKPFHARHNTELSHSSNIKQTSAVVSDVPAGLNYSHHNLKKQENSIKFSKVKTKQEDLTESVTPSKRSQIKDNEHQEKPLASAREKLASKKKELISPVKANQAPAQKKAGCRPVKLKSMNSSIDEGSFQSTKIRQSTNVSDLRAVTEKLDELPEKKDSVAELTTEFKSRKVNNPENSESILSKHQEIKNKLLRQIRGESDEEEEEEVRSIERPKRHSIEQPKFEGTFKALDSKLEITSYSRDFVSCY